MLFSSLEFLYLFLPLSVGGYFLCPRRFKNLWLLIVSLVFYGFGEPVYLFLMLFTVAVDYGFGLVIERSERGRRVWLIAAVIFNLSLLGFFKYYGFFASLAGLPQVDIPLPIGISFYTFQALSYVIDVYRKQTRAGKDPVAFGAYVSLFPQLVAGPIVRYSDVEAELSCRRHSTRQIAEGIGRFSVGLSKKVLLANGAGELSAALLSDGGSCAELWLGLCFYAFQIYYDFSGYSDMAIGLGSIFGFHFPENFNYPYVSKSITEFWRRWHMTLSSFFREYVYFPLGGSRRGRARTCFNLFVVWSLTGLWHGAAVNFILWGIYFFILLLLEKTFLLRLLDGAPKLLRHGYALFFILLGWLIFSADGLESAELLTRAGGLFGIGMPLFGDGTLYELLRSLPSFIIMAVGATPWVKGLFGALGKKRPAVYLAARNILALCGILLSTAYLAGAEYNPFLYFRF